MARAAREEEKTPPRGQNTSQLASLLRGMPELEGKRALIAAAEARSASRRASGMDEADVERAAIIGLAGDALGRLALAGKPRIAASHRILRRAEKLTGLPSEVVRDAVGQRALRDLERVALAPRVAMCAQLSLLAGIPPVRETALWQRGPAGGLEVLAQGGGRDTRAVRQAVRGVLDGAGATPVSPRRTILALPVGEAASPLAALTARVKPGESGAGLSLLELGAPLLALVLERNALLEAGEVSLQTATRAAENRLVRLGFDLHDGPAQTASALLADMHLFGGQLESALPADSRAEVLGGRLEDLKARVLALNEEIRELSRVAQAPSFLREDFADVLRSEVRAYARVTGVAPELTVEGPVQRLSPSQRVALLRGIQEALRNAREHASARAVHVRVAATSRGVEAEVRDDGRGFDVSRSLLRARRDGRMGLIGIAERARLLGGRCELRSRPGGPTSVTITLPRWEPEGEPASG